MARLTWEEAKRHAELFPTEDLLMLAADYAAEIAAVEEHLALVRTMRRAALTVLEERGVSVI